MPRRRKKKKLTEEEIKEKFEEWRSQPDGEYALLCELREMGAHLNLGKLSELDTDLTSKCEQIFPIFQKVGAVFKVKKSRKIKPIKQIFLRTAFFAGKKNSNFYNWSFKNNNF
jgi:hypothetical protein